MAADQLPDLLDENLRRGEQASSFSEILLDLAGLDRAGRTELAELLSGTSNKRSREYKNARRRVERWEKNGTARITPKSRKQLRGARRSFGNERHDRFRRAGANMRVLITWYEGQREEWLPPGRWLHIAPPTMTAVIQYWSEGDVEIAAGALYSAFLDTYGVPNIDDWQMETEVIGLELETI
jgi:hypothetical protein